VTSGNKTNPLKIQIADVCRIGNGYAFKSPEYRDNGIPLLRISNIANERVSFDKGTIYLDENCLVTHKDFVVNKGDVLIALSGATTGKYGIYELEEPCLLNQRIGIIRSGNSKDLDSKYFYFYFYLSQLRSEILRKAQGAAQPNISTKEIGQFKIPLPPLPEQQNIASILDAADSLRQKDQQLIEKYTALSQSLFLEMFGDPVSNPMAFEKSTVGEQCIVKGGKRVPKGDSLVKENTGYPYIKAGNIKNGKVTIKNLEYLTSETRERIKNYIVNEGDVCITVVGANIGDIGIVPKELHLANLTENANKLLIKNHMALNNFYLCFSLQMESIQQQINKKTMAVGVPKLALFRIQELEILVPPITLQNKFTESIQSIEAQKQQAQASLQKSAALFNSLLQRAFKGELTD
jgi:type I restriction enzyme S subunit